MHLEDITEHEDLRRRLQHQATHDALTGLATRGHFLDELRRALLRGTRHHQPVSVLYLDLNGFKAVNDHHGHAAGDRLLRAFADHVRDSVRPEDTPARLGGDEFAILCEDTTAAQAALVVDRLDGGAWGRRTADGGAGAATSSTTGIEPGVDVGVVTGVAIGVATSPDADGHDLDAEDLLHRADEAMYRAKARQRS